MRIVTFESRDIRENMSAIIIRKATSADAVALATVHHNSWKTTYKGIVSQEYLDGLDLDKAKQNWQKRFQVDHESIILVAEIDNKIVGYAMGGKIRPESLVDDFQGELQAIYFIEEFQGKGLGKRLIQQFAEELINIGISNMVIWALKANRASKFYLKLGGEIINNKIYNIGGAEHIAVVFCIMDLNKLIKK